MLHWFYANGNIVPCNGVRPGVPVKNAVCASFSSCGGIFSQPTAGWFDTDQWYSAKNGVWWACVLHSFFRNYQGRW